MNNEPKKLKKPLWIRKAVAEQNPRMTPVLYYSMKYKLDPVDQALGTTRFSEPHDMFHTMNMN